MEAENPQTGKPSSLFWLAAALVFILGAFLRLYRVGQQIILDDEWHALNAVQDHDYAWIFSHLGEADHSIPLTLLYEFFSHTIGLSEMSMRFPSLLAGLLALVLLPWLWRHWLSRGECLLFAALIAISPFLVNYSRIARPYALLALLAGAAVILAWRWWQSENGSRGYTGFAWLACAVLAAWINPVSLAVTAGPFLWFGASAVHSMAGGKNYQPLRRVLVMGLSLVFGVTLLMYSPLAGDFGSLSIKAGFHQAGTGTFAEALSLFSGSGYLAVIIIMVAAAMMGWLGLYQRDRAFTLYLLLIMLTSTIAVMLTGAAWIIYGLVLARYLIGLLPVFLALAAIGVVSGGGRLLAALRVPPQLGQVLLSITLLGLFLAGPLPFANAGRSQFVHHMSNQFDYDFERNPIRAALEPVVPENFYAEIADLHPEGDAVIVEAPWHLESNWNALPLYQSVHGQQVMVGFVGGLCAGKLYGELNRGTDGLEFSNFVFVSDVLRDRGGVDYLVLRNRAPAGAREIAMEFSECEKSARAALGEPWRETDSAIVFRISDGS